MTLRPCLVCGAPSEQSRCPDDRPKPTNKVRPKGHVHTNTTRWKRLSAKARKASPFCEICSATQTLSADHIIPVSERPDLAHEILNIRVLCLVCNGRRGNNCTDEEREAVLARLQARQARLARFYASDAETVAPARSQGCGMTPTATIPRPSGKARSALHTPRRCV